MKILFLAAALVVSLSSAQAQSHSADLDAAIAAYNEAVGSGDRTHRVEAAAAMANATPANPDASDAGLLAYEAGQTLCVYNKCVGAAPIASFAVGKTPSGGSIREADIQLLKAYADWRDNAKRKTRTALDDALEIIGPLDATMLSISAFHARYVADLQRGDWDKAANSASTTAVHLEPLKNTFGEMWSDAKIAAIAASFNHAPDSNQPIAMTHHLVELSKMRASLDEPPEWMADHYFTADAWQMAMTAFFLSTEYSGSLKRIKGPNPARLQSEIDAINATAEDQRQTPDPKSAEPVSTGDDLPFCNGNLEMNPSLRYPGSAAIRGKFGAVIVSFSIDDLNVENVEVLAAVPSSTFEEMALETVEQWKWVVEGDSPGTNCSTSRDNVILPLVFALG